MGLHFIREAISVLTAEKTLQLHKLLFPLRIRCSKTLGPRVESVTQKFREGDKDTLPHNALMYSFLVTIFCCQLLGIVAIVFAILAIIADGKGNRKEAIANANVSMRLIKVSFYIGIVIWVITILFACFGKY